MFGTRYQAAVDLGEESLRYAVVDPRSGTVAAAWSGLLLPARASAKESLQGAELEDRVRALVADLARTVRPFHRTVAAVVQGADTFCGYLELPPLKDAELRTAVPGAAARLLPFPLDEVVLTYVGVKPYDPAARKSSVFYLAVRQEHAARVRDVLEKVGLHPTSFTVPALALAREAAVNRPEQKGGFVALVDVGYTLTQVVVARDGQPYFFRDFRLAGADFTYALQMAAQSSWAEAEAAKRAYDATHRHPSIESYMIRWLEEVERSLGSFRAPGSGEPVQVERVYLSGGSAALRNLPARLAEHLGLPVEVDGWSRVRMAGRSSEEPSAAFKLVVGAALQG